MLDLNVIFDVQGVKDLRLPDVSTVTNSGLEAAKYPPFRLNYIPEITFSTINTKPMRQEHYTITLVMAKEQPVSGPDSWKQKLNSQ